MLLYISSLAIPFQLPRHAKLSRILHKYEVEVQNSLVARWWSKSVDMFIHQLHSIVQRDNHTRDRFLGIYAADELLKRMPPQSLAIVNCYNRYYRGEHWLYQL